MESGFVPAPAEHDALAWFYRNHWCAGYDLWAAAVLERILPQHVDRGSSLVELCCGTGAVTKSLAAQGYYVTGVERSPAMIGFAREEVPEAFFLECDIRAFRMPLAFNGAVCAYASLNQLAERRELRHVFENVSDTLLPRGVFVFDMHREEVYRGEWSEPRTVVEEDNAVILRASYDPIERLGRAEITMFRENEGGWRRFDAALTERCYDPGEVRAMLEEAGFAGIEVLDALRDLGIEGQPGEGRDVFVAVKPSAATRLRAERSSIPLRSHAASKARRRKAAPVPQETETR